MDFVGLGGNAECLGAAPSDRAHVGVLLVVAFEDQPLGGVDLGHAIGNFEVEHARRSLEALAVRGALKNLAAVGALALEHAACVVQAVCEHVDLAVGGWDQPTVEPDEVGTLVEGHGHGIPPLSLLFGMACSARRRPDLRLPRKESRARTRFCVGTGLPVWFCSPRESTLEARWDGRNAAAITRVCVNNPARICQ